MPPWIFGKTRFRLMSVYITRTFGKSVVANYDCLARTCFPPCIRGFLHRLKAKSSAFSRAWNFAKPTSRFVVSLFVCSSSRTYTWGDYFRKTRLRQLWKSTMKQRAHSKRVLLSKRSCVPVSITTDDLVFQEKSFQTIFVASATRRQAKARFSVATGSVCVSRAPRGASSMLGGTIQASAGR